MALNGILDGNLLDKANFEALMKSLGTYGTNPARPLDRRSQVLHGILSILQGQYGLGLEGLRQGTLNAYINNLNPANVQSRVDAVSRMNRSAAARNAEQMAVMAPSLGVSPASIASYYANADRNTAQYGQQLRSNQGMSEAYSGLMNAIGAAQNPQMAQILSQLQGAMHQSNAAHNPSKGNGLGSVLGSIGQIAGMFGGGGTTSLLQNAVNQGRINAPTPNNPFYW